MPITMSQVKNGSIVVYFDVDQQTSTSLEDVLAALEVRILLLRILLLIALLTSLLCKWKMKDVDDVLRTLES